MATWDKEEAAESTAKAKKEFDEMFAKMSAEEQAAIVKVADWARKWFNGASGFHATGHKSLMQYLVYNIK